VYLYGSTRVGEHLLNRDNALPWNLHYCRVKGNRHYELTNHQGNDLKNWTPKRNKNKT
jgi:hypothetical protein